MSRSLTHYDPTEDLASDTAIATFMAEAFETEDASYIAHALGVAVRASAQSSKFSDRLLVLFLPRSTPFVFSIGLEVL